MRKWVLSSFVLLCAAAAIPVRAGDRLGIGVKAGTYGLGIDFTARMNSFVSLRATLSRWDYSESFEESDIEYDGELRAGGAGLLVDIHPFKGNFRVTGGLLKNRNEVDLDGTPTAPITIGDTEYQPHEVGSLTGKVEFDDNAWYLGVGFGNAARGPGRFRFLLDFGAVQQGSPDFSLSSSSGLVDPADLEQEVADAEEDTKDYKWWPVIALGFSVRL